MCYSPCQMRVLLFATLVAAGCAPTTAVVDGKTVPRLSMEFVGQPFVVRASDAHPQPGSPSGGLRDSGGHVSGNVCGLEITYDVDHQGDKTHLTGFIDGGSFESQLDVRDDRGIRRLITGSLTNTGGVVQIEVLKNHIRGVVGHRRFELARRDDQYLGWIKIMQSGTAPATINGADELWTLPPATQAAVLPSLLTCYGDAIEDKLGGSFVVGFGGRQTWEAHHVSSIYHAQTIDESRASRGQNTGIRSGFTHGTPGTGGPGR
jgi:hypothetical protein